MKRLSLLFLFLLAFVANLSATQLTGLLKKPNGEGFTGALYLSIAAQAGVRSGSCGGPFLLVPTTLIVVNVDNGVMLNAPNIVGGECTLPISMPYYSVLRDPNGNVMFSTMWLITGTTQDVGTVYAGPADVPPTAAVMFYGIGTPGSNGYNPCTASSIYVQTDAPPGTNTWICVNGTFLQQGIFTLTIGDISALGTLPNNISGNAATASAFNHTPTLCAAGVNFAVGVLPNGNAVCANIAGGGGGAPNTTNLLSGNGSGGISDSGIPPGAVARLDSISNTFAGNIAIGGGQWALDSNSTIFQIGLGLGFPFSMDTGVPNGGIFATGQRFKLTNMWYDTDLGYQYQGTAPLNHFLCGNGTRYIDCQGGTVGDQWFEFDTCTIAQTGNTYSCGGTFSFSSVGLSFPGGANLLVGCTVMNPGPVASTFNLTFNSLNTSGFQYVYGQYMGNGTSGSPHGGHVMCTVHQK